MRRWSSIAGASFHQSFQSRVRGAVQGRPSRSCIAGSGARAHNCENSVGGGPQGGGSGSSAPSGCASSIARVEKTTFLENAGSRGPSCRGVPTASTCPGMELETNEEISKLRAQVAELQKPCKKSPAHFAGLPHICRHCKEESVPTTHQTL